MSEPTPEAVEAAAKAIMSSEHIEPPYAAFSRDYPDDLDGLRHADLEADRQNMAAMREVATAALSAAAPFLIREAQAQALEEAAKALDLPGSSATGYYSGNDDAGYREAENHTENWLRARAAAIRDGGQ
jgi:hypothetical protein